MCYNKLCSIKKMTSNSTIVIIYGYIMEERHMKALIMTMALGVVKIQLNDGLIIPFIGS